MMFEQLSFSSFATGASPQLTCLLLAIFTLGMDRFGMNLDMGLIAVLTAACSMFGLPWLVAATVRSLAHVKSLTNYEQLGGGEERITGIVEQRCEW